VTALVTPAGDYVGGLQVGTLDVRFAAEEEEEALGEALRSFVGQLDEGTTLHFLYRVDEKTSGFSSMITRASIAWGPPEWHGCASTTHTYPEMTPSSPFGLLNPCIRSAIASPRKIGTRFVSLWPGRTLFRRVRTSSAS
jgi:hypothetical protein